MTRLLLCTAMILVASVTTSSAQRSHFGPNSGGNSPNSGGVYPTGNYPTAPGYTCAYTTAKGACIDAPKPAQPQRAKQPRR
jgi:hypothetical protein